MNATVFLYDPRPPAAEAATQAVQALGGVAGGLAGRGGHGGREQRQRLGGHAAQVGHQVDQGLPVLGPGQLGAVVGGLLVGILEAMGAGYISSAYKDAIPFVLILLILFFMPRGLFGGNSTDRV